MGVVNVTPDSFSDGGRFVDPDVAIAHALGLVAAGATIVDVGGESTRPGARPVDPAEERRRVLPVIAALAASGDAVVSVDTRHPETATAALDAGAHMVNDVRGLRDPAMRAVCAEAGVPAVVMHMRGEPATMQQAPAYDDVVAEVWGWLGERAGAALADGVPSVLVDPGIGFGKTFAHNLALIRSLPGPDPAMPVLVGASRKRFVRTLGGLDDTTGSDAASIAVHLFAAQRGAAMVRVHDVAGHVQALAADAALRSGSEP
jgi:dihydropteroate synthase